MSNEFARMLRVFIFVLFSLITYQLKIKILQVTLEKMQDRIELAKWDNDDNPQMMKKLKDFAGLN